MTTRDATATTSRNRSARFTTPTRAKATRRRPASSRREQRGAISGSAHASGEHAELVADDCFADAERLLAVHVKTLYGVAGPAYLAHDLGDSCVWIVVEQVLRQDGPVPVAGAAAIGGLGRTGNAADVEGAGHRAAPRAQRRFGERRAGDRLLSAERGQDTATRHPKPLPKRAYRPYCSARC